MNYGLYLSASGVLTNMYRQDVFANNLANSETVGFKPDAPSIRQREPEAIEDHLGFGASQRLLDKLGGGVLAGPQGIRFAPGPMRQTGNPFDAALQDDQSFFAVEAGEGKTSYTRDGRFTLNGEGALVNQNGHAVLGAAGQRIIVPGDTKARIDAHGRVVATTGEVLGQLRVVRIPDTRHLVKQGGGLFSYTGNAEPEVVAAPVVQAGHVEGSGVDPIKTLMDMTNSGKAAQANADLIKFFDRLMEHAVTTFGRIA